MMRRILIPIALIVLLFVAWRSDSATSSKIAPVGDQPVSERLPKPFGTIMKIQAAIVDGRELNDKYHQSDFLLSVTSVDSVQLAKPVMMEFRDETGDYPNDNFKLFKHVYHRKTGELTDKQIEKIKRGYVGRQIKIAAYESGEFRGTPNGYFEYQPARQDFGFHFNNYLIVVGNLEGKQ